MTDPISRFLLEDVQPEITLKSYDQDYFDSLPSDKKWLDLVKEDIPNLRLFTVFVGGQKAGITGCRIYKQRPTHGFFIIYIEKRFRGQKLLCPIASKVFEALKLKAMSSTVEKTNEASIKSHKHSGCFKQVDPERESELRDMGFLKETDTRFEYHS